MVRLSTQKISQSSIRWLSMALSFCWQASSTLPFDLCMAFSAVLVTANLSAPPTDFSKPTKFAVQTSHSIGQSPRTRTVEFSHITIGRCASVWPWIPIVRCVYRAFDALDRFYVRRAEAVILSNGYWRSLQCSFWISKNHSFSFQFSSRHVSLTT